MLFNLFVFVIWYEVFLRSMRNNDREQSIAQNALFLQTTAGSNLLIASQFSLICAQEGFQSFSI